MYFVGLGAHTYEINSLSIAIRLMGSELLPIANREESIFPTRAASEAKRALRSLHGDWFRDLEPNWTAAVGGKTYFITKGE